MNVLSVSNVSKMGRERPLFGGVTFGLDEGEKAAVIGRNGSGKSTLLGIISGAVSADDGLVVLQKDAGLSYLSQNPEFSGEDSIRAHIFKSDSPKLKIITEYEELCGKMGGGFSLAQQRRFDELTLEMEKRSLWNYEAQVRSVLGTLGINNLDRKMKTLSGGMIKKVALAQVLVEDTKLLLLDEPTNHLDVQTIYWLQNYLRDTKRAVLMVTHDRYFLDAVCGTIYELARQRVKLYQGNYSSYLEKKEIEAQIEENTERRIESVLRFERNWLMRGPCARGTKAKARIQRDMQLIHREKFAKDKGFQFEVAGRRLGGKILELHSVGKNFPKGNVSGGAPVLIDFSYTFSKGEKIGIFGGNGSGKSTLLNIIMGTVQPDLGEVVKGENTVFGYYQQNPVFADLGLTVLEYIKEAADVVRMNDGTVLSAALFLNRFGFEGKIQHSKLSTLSGGERKRVFLVRLLISNPNFLILDEPTNDFDIFTMNILEEFLSGYDGCLLVVSHDRYFMDKVADTLLILDDDGGVSGFVGKCSEYIQFLESERAEKERCAKEKSRKGEASPSLQPAGQSSATHSAGEHSPATPPAGARKKKRSFKEQKEFEQLEAEILALEEKKSVLETQMASSDFAVVRKAGEEYAAVENRLAAAYVRWEELAELE